MAGWFPGWPGTPFFGGRPVISLPAAPALPAHPGGPAAAASSPLAGLAAYGVPVGQTKAGHAFIQAGEPGESGLMLPPEIPGMPRMPGPPDGGGLFRAVPPVAPFDPGNQVRLLQTRPPQSQPQLLPDEPARG